MENKSQVSPSNSLPKCSICGISGIHACLGVPAREWTEEEKAGLKEALKRYGWKDEEPFDLEKELCRVEYFEER